MKYRPDIDGLRAVAVLPVVLFHAGVHAIGGGYVGVDVFFVISGYLITSMIAPDIRDNKFSIARFYERRIRRIFPALFAVIIAASIAAWWLLPPFDLVDYGRSVLGASGFSSNFLFWIQSGYFDAPAHLKPLLHTWSLAVEEQVYIVFPLLLLVLRGRQRRTQLAVLGALFVVSLAACIWVTGHRAPAAFYLAPFRGWELLTGSLIALGAIPALTRPVLRELCGAAGLALIGWSILCLTESTPFPGAYALAPCIGAGLIIHAGRDGSSVIGAILAREPLVFIGKISYSLYLWHWPFLVFVGFWFVHPMTPGQSAMVIGLSGIASILSWRFVEQPLRHTKANRRQIFASAALATGVAVAFGGATQLTHGWPSRASAQARRFDAARGDRSPDRERCHASDDRPIPFDRKCVYGPPGTAPTLAIWGDSFGAELGYELGQAARTRGKAVLYISFSACGPAVGVFDDDPICERHNEHVLDHLMHEPALKTVVLVARYVAYKDRNGGRFLSGFEQVATRLADAGKHVIVVYPIPAPPGHVPSVLARLAMLGRDLHEAEIDRASYERDNHDTIAALDELVHHPGIRGAHPERALCDADRCRVTDGTQVLYFDVDHLSRAGARLVLPELGVF